MTQPADRHSELPLDPDLPDAGGGDPLQSATFSPSMFAAVAVGGFFGALARYGVSLLEPTTTGRWPTGTLTVNLAGAFVLGVLLESLARNGADVGRRRLIRLLLGTGFCGALTTYSTLAVEADLLTRDHRAGLAMLYLIVSVIGGLVATGAGIAVASRRRHRPRRSAT